MQRREFIGYGIRGLGIMAGIGMLSACTGIRRCDLPGEWSGLADNRAISEQQRMRMILYFASLAPSGHNSQPWKVTVQNSTLEITLDEDRLLPAVDPLKCESLLSLGAFVENLTLAAGALGYESEIEFIENRQCVKIVVYLKFSREDFHKKQILTKIKNRRVVKKNLQKKEIALAHIQMLQRHYGTGCIYYPAQSHISCKINQLAVEAMKEQGSRDSANRELAQWIRLSDEEAKEKRDGLTTESMEINGIAGWYVRNVMKREKLFSRDFAEKGVEQTRQQVSSHAGWLMLYAEGSSSSEIVQSGMKFERMFLECREIGIAIHPMSQILEEEKAQDELRILMGEKDLPQFILRTGYLDKYPYPVSMRRTVESFTNFA